MLRMKTEEMKGGRTWSSLELKGKNCTCTRSSHGKPVGCFVSPVLPTTGNAGHASSAKLHFHVHTVSLDPLPTVHN